MKYFLITSYINDGWMDECSPPKTDNIDTPRGGIRSAMNDNYLIYKIYLSYIANNKIYKKMCVNHLK